MRKCVNLYVVNPSWRGKPFRNVLDLYKSLTFFFLFARLLVMKKLGKLIIVLLVVVVIFFLFFKLKTLLSPLSGPFDDYQFLTDLKEKIIKEDWLDSKNYDGLTLEKEEGKYAGFDWINKNNQVELVKAYSLYYNPFGNSFTYSDPTIADGAEKIKEYLLNNGFKLNNQNTFFMENEESFWAKENGGGGRLGFERGAAKCILTPLFLSSSFGKSGFVFACGDSSSNITPSVYQEIYNLQNPENDLKMKVNIDNSTDNFAVGGISDGIGGAALLWKKEDGKWKVIDSTQMAWDCQILIGNQVPPALFSNPETECIYYDQSQGSRNYNQLYQETFGQ